MANLNLCPVFFKTIEVVCDFWNTEPGLSTKGGFTVSASRKSIAQAHVFAADILKDNAALPVDPGPFKTTAAFLVSALFFVEFHFFPLNKDHKLNEYEQRLWKSRFLFKAITVFLLQLKLSKTGKSLTKEWDAPSIHYRLDLLNFMRWCELPLIGPSTPPPPNKPVIDVVRVTRLVMAFTLIIEACYYLSGNEVKCDVKNHVHIAPADFEELVRPDLDFDCPEECKPAITI